MPEQFLPLFSFSCLLVHNDNAVVESRPQMLVVFPGWVWEEKNEAVRMSVFEWLGWA